MCQACALRFPRELIDSRAKPHKGGCHQPPHNTACGTLLTAVYGEPKNPQILQSQRLQVTEASCRLYYSMRYFNISLDGTAVDTRPHLLPRAGLPVVASLTNVCPHAACAPLETGGSLPFGA